MDSYRIQKPEGVGGIGEAVEVEVKIDVEAGDQERCAEKELMFRSLASPLLSTRATVDPAQA